LQSGEQNKEDTENEIEYFHITVLNVNERKCKESQNSKIKSQKFVSAFLRALCASAVTFFTAEAQRARRNAEEIFDF
jgi:hypothetical protein